MTLTVIILTYNEKLHLARAIESTKLFADRVVVVDSGSTDTTTKIAQACGAEVLTNPWTNYATQFNWAMRQLGGNTRWIMRLDADEFVTQGLANEIVDYMASAPDEVDGLYLSRRMTFLGKAIRYGGIFPIRVLRLFRSGRGRCEDRWMDEHIIVEGQTAELKGEIIDDNLNHLSWWTEKHNSYASREVIDILNLEYGFLPSESVANLRDHQQAGIKRWIKEKIYFHLPLGFRAFAYFIYRYLFRLGFLDGKEGAAFHVLQGFWYRFLVDAKLLEVRNYMLKWDADPVTAIDKVLNVRVIGKTV